MSSQSTTLMPVARIERRRVLLRSEQVLLDSDLAEPYGVETKIPNQAVQRNLERFPEDFMFRLSADEFRMILKSQIVTSSWGYGGRRKLPYAVTEQGVAMLLSVLRSDRAVQVNIAIMRAFVQLRQILATHADLAKKLEALARKYDKQFRGVFDAIRALMVEKTRPRREIGFHTLMGKPVNSNDTKAKRLLSHES